MSDSSRLSRPAMLRRLALAAVVTNVGIVLTGGIVRLTGSGLGCPDWPTCEAGRVLPAGVADTGWHQAIEFGNRLLTVVVLAVAVAAYLAARRAAVTADVRRLAAALPVGVLAQAVLGGITVLTDLNPLIVAGHFLLSMVLIAIAVALHERTRGTAAPGPVGPGLRSLSAGVVVLAAVVLVLGTLVTATGPHAGDPGTPRLGLDIRTIVRLHAGAVWTVVAATAATWLLARHRGRLRLARGAGMLLAVEVVQGGVGYTQYALGIPAALVAVHLLLACLFWVAAVRLALLGPAGGRVAADGSSVGTGERERGHGSGEDRRAVVAGGHDHGRPPGGGRAGRGGRG